MDEWIVMRDGLRYVVAQCVQRWCLGSGYRFHRNEKRRARVPDGWRIQVDGDRVHVTKPDGAVTEWHHRPATNGSGMYDLCQALATSPEDVETVRPWPKSVQDECLEVLRNMDIELGAMGRKSARIERLINAIAGMPSNG